MAKITVEGNVYEGTPEELKEIFEMMGVKFPEVIEEEKFSVGDYVKVTKSIYEYNKGDIVKIVVTDGDLTHSSFDFKVLRLSHGGYGYVSLDWVQKATDEEVMKFKAELGRKQAEKVIKEKWAKIGRKPNEFKKGDIVRVTEVDNSNHKVGDVGEITDVSGIQFKIKTPRTNHINWLKKEHMELLAPTETRFDEAK